jgi:hypothetical protein
LNAQDLDAHELHGIQPVLIYREQVKAQLVGALAGLAL